jgi:hypothetical protein
MRPVAPGYLAVALLIAFVCCSGVMCQEMKYAGTRPPEKAVLKLVKDYQTATSTNWKTIAERDAKRRKFVSDGYFYHGTDGKPIDFAGLTARQTKNDLTIESSPYDLILYQYETVAILAYHSHDKGMDKGEPFEGYGSNLIVMSKEKGVWKIIADILGADVSPPTKP